MTSVNEYGQPVGVEVPWSGARAPERRTFVGRFVELRPLTASDAEEFCDAFSGHPELFTYMPDAPPVSVARCAEAIERANQQSDAQFMAIRSKSGEFLGRVAYLRIQPAVGSIEVGWITYTPSLQRSRPATELQYLLMAQAFELGYRRYEWKCNSLNAASRSAASRLGFVEEGTWRNALVVKGRNRDTTWFSVTDAEWPIVRAGFETWLDDSNFDADGNQLASLADCRVRS